MKFLKKSPDSLVIVSVILFLFMILTWVIPAGEYERMMIDGRMVVVPDTYQAEESQGQGFFELLKAPLRGFEGAMEIIAFVLLVGGAFQMMTSTGAIDAALFKILEYAKKRPGAKGWIIALLMTIFSLAGMTFGMSEETLVFALITIPLARSMGYDALVGVAIPFIGAGMGFAGAAFNPFTVGIAQGIAEIPLFSGFEYRLIVWLLFTALAILFVLNYTRKLDRGSSAAFVAEGETEVQMMEAIELTPARKFVLVLFVFSLIFVMLGAMRFDWYIPEICALFISLGVLSTLVSGSSTEEAVEAFYTGARAMLPAAVIIALSKSILVIATDGKIIDTMLYHTAGAVEGLPAAVSVQLMFIIQGFINFFIPSGSGQAAITMPIMTPLADLIGISRQTAVLAYQLGDGLFNLIIPTSGVTMGILAIGDIPFDKWVKWIWKLMVAAVILAFIMLALPVTLFEWA
ncbi:MAG: putative basic amino acid antiporter YfcC [Flavobacteriales bacterium]|nr:putative basic amino acid antiporter YfcC [Flavobacteriales bacterium]